MREHVQESVTRDLDLIWGAQNIATAIGRTTFATHALLKAGHIPCAKKIGKQWCVDRRTLERMFTLAA